MAISGVDTHLISETGVSSPQRGHETLETRAEDVRSVVERQFSLMEQAHDRIRAEELAAHRRERLTS